MMIKLLFERRMVPRMPDMNHEILNMQRPRQAHLQHRYKISPKIGREQSKSPKANTRTRTNSTFSELLSFILIYVKVSSASMAGSTIKSSKV